MFSDQATFYSALTLLLGTGATVTALGGLAVREGGKFYHLTMRGTISVLMLLGATVCGITKEVINERDNRNLRQSLAEASRSLEDQVAENADLTRQLLELGQTRKIVMEERIEDGRLRLLNFGSVSPTQVQITEIALIDVSFGMREPGVPWINERWIFDLPVTSGDLIPYRFSEPDILWGFDIAALEQAQERFNDEITEQLKASLPSSRAEASPSYHLRIRVCGMIEAEDGFGGKYSKVFTLSRHQPIFGDSSTRQSTAENWEDCQRLQAQAAPYSEWGKGGFDIAATQLVVGPQIYELIGVDGE